MKTITVTGCLALALLIPASAIAKVHPDQGDKRAASTECKTLRGNTDATREAFRTLYSSFGACVRKTAVDEAKEEQSAHSNAAKECKAERALDADAFKANYGTGPNGRNAFGKCVSKKAKAKEHAADEQDAQDATEFKNAAKECDAERQLDSGAFAEHYGTNDNDSNAFGKCVSSKVTEDEESAPTS